MSLPGRWFQKLRYQAIAQTLGRLNQRYRFTGSPVFRPVVLPAAEPAVALSISPHPDDDIIAVGGSLVGHAVAGGEVHSVVLTDGACGTDDATEQKDLVDLRRHETETAADILKFNSLSFWEEPDGRLRSHSRVIDDLYTMIRELRPAYIYTPFPIDYHYDHIEATRIVIRALSRMGDPPPLRCYESIIPLVPNKIIDITDVIDFKRRAVACFESQNAVTDYSRTIVEGLNRHRSYGSMRGRGYGEAVFQADWQLVAEIMRWMHGNNEPVDR